MIIDMLGSSFHYGSSSVWTKIFEFLRSATPGIEDGRYPIQGDDIFAIAMSYNTRDRTEGILEAHRKYVDVQAVLSGSERCEWHPAEGLAATHPYDDAKDAEFYRAPELAPAQFVLSPGLFAVFFPGDGHMTSLVAGDVPEAVKKVVVKIRADLLAPDGWMDSRVN